MSNDMWKAYMHTNCQAIISLIKSLPRKVKACPEKYQSYSLALWGGKDFLVANMS